jgi:Ca2+-binding EF-hand superfamily protein
MPALASNPLRNRVAEVFCSARDSEQDPVEWSFDDFLQFFNAFSYRSSLLSSWIQSDLADLKIYWAFRIFDFDNDNKITQDDMEIAVALMAGDRRVTREQIAAIAAAVIREGDQDDSNSISRTEFKRVLQRVPDFQWYASADCFAFSRRLFCGTFAPFAAHIRLSLADLFLRFARRHFSIPE